MNKFYKMLFILLITLFCSINTVEAVKTTCTYEEKANLNDIASKVSSNYKIDEIKEEYEFENPDTGEVSLEERTKIKFKVSLYNILEDIYITQIDNLNNEELNIYYSELQNGVYTFETDNTSDIIKYNYYIYSNIEGCRGEILKTLVFTKPKANMYYQMEICDGLEDNPLCQKYITEDINLTEDEFYAKIHELNKKKEEVKKEENKEGITDFLKDNYIYFIFGAIVISGSVIGFIIVRKRSSL